MNFNKRHFQISRLAAFTTTFAASALLVGAGVMLSASGGQAIDPSTADFRLADEETQFVVEIKEHLASNAQNDIDPAEGNLVFSRGDTFVLDGTIYPDHSIPPGPGMEPVPGARKLGKYIQRGVFTANFDQFEKALAGVRDVTPVVAFATESLAFKDGSSILTDGLWPNADRTTNRVVLGGTGRYRGVVGEVIEENIGEDTDGICNLRMTFKIRSAGRGR